MTTAENGRDIEERVRQYYEQYKALPVIGSALERLEQGLSTEFCFHSSAHTRNVLKEAIRFAVYDGLPEDDIHLLAIAAAFHDTGFLARPIDNEPLGAQYARAALQSSGRYSPAQIVTVETMILDTRLLETENGPRQIPSIPLSRYLLDADLSNLGRNDFFERAELLRRELGVERDLFFRQTARLLEHHRWLTPAARRLRQSGLEANRTRLLTIIEEAGIPFGEEPSDGLSLDRILFLNKLPLLLNSSLNLRQVMNIALEHLKSMLGAEAATVFLLDDDAPYLTFWALKGQQARRLEGMKMPAGKGIVGWVIENREAVLIRNAENDPRFFSEIDKEGGFRTRNLICVPLIARGEHLLGAIQVLNKAGDDEFGDADLRFLDQMAHQMALAIDNARLYEFLQERNRKLHALDQRKNEMISVISHEFRTPLNVIQSAAEMLSSGVLHDGEALQQMAQTLRNGVQRLTKLTSQTLNLSFVTAGEVRLRPAPLKAGEPIRTVFEKFEPIAAERKLRLSARIPKEAIEIRADRSLLLIALTNLVSNAIRFTPDGGSIEVGALRRSGLVEFFVRDTGIGIEDEQLELIFEKFYEVGAAIQHSSGDFAFKSGGLGIGLATARAIVREHGGDIEVESVHGQGSTFRFALPVL